MPRLKPRIKISIAIMIVLLSGLADATVSVKPGQSIQPFINAAHPGQIIEVHGGIYHERINLTKQLTLKGVGNPLVDAGGIGSAITISANGSALLGFTATGSGDGTKDAGIKILSQGNMLKGNTAIKNGNSGIFLFHASNNTIVGNIARENQNAGMRLVHSNNNQILSNYAGMNRDGLFIDTSRGNTIKANNLSGNSIGINISNYNLSESITAKGKGVSIKYRSNNDVKSYNVSKMSLSSTPGANHLYQNDLLENDQNAFDDGFNQWDNSTVGNHYSNYDAREEGCKDRNRDGICDSGYSIPGGHNVDRLPKASSDAILQYKSKGFMASELKMDQRTYQPNELIAVKYQAPKNFSGWIGVAKAGEDIDLATALSFQKIQGDEGRAEVKAPADNGSYDLWMYNSTDNGKMVSLNFHVGIPSISATPTSVNACELITVNYISAPGYENDWIAMYRSGSGDASYITRQYLNGDENGTVTLEAPDPGIYNFRIFENDSYVRLATSNNVEATALAGNKVIASPSHVAPGGTVTVTYWGAPPEGTGVVGMYGMTGQDKFPLGMVSIGSKSCGSITWQLPYDPGQYDFRMFRSAITDVGQGAYQILGQSNVVTVG